MNKLDVIMSVYDEPVIVLKKTLRSLSDQTLVPDKVIVCLDNPENLSVKKYLFAIGDEFGFEIKVILNKKNIGLGYSLNNCIDISTAKYIARMDADDTIREDRFEKQCAFLEKVSGIDTVVFTGCVVVKGVEVVSPHLNIKDPTPEKDFFNKNPYKHGTLMMRSELYKKYKYNISNAPEDYELYFRMLKDYVSFSYINEPLYFHHKFIKSTYRKDVDSFSRHSKMLKIYFWLLCKNYLFLRGWDGYNRTLINTFFQKFIFVNYRLYKLMKFFRGGKGND